MKASRIKSDDPDQPAKKNRPSPFASERWQRLRILFRDSFKETMRDAAAFVLLAVLAVAVWYFFIRGTEAPKKILPVEGKAAELIAALEKHHSGAGVYPKTLREVYPPQKVASGLIYRGRERELVPSEECVPAPFSDPCWTGYRRYLLLAEDGGKSYVYSSDNQGWKEV